MRLIVDENIAFAKEAFSSFGELKLLNGRDIINDEVKDVDVLIVRSITRIGEKLLKNSTVKFIGTATIGTDHIDKNFLESKRIKFSDAKGCNADSVAEYVFTALLKVATKEKISLRGKTIGIVGVGNIGSRIVKLAESLGLKVLKNDPPLERKGIGKNYIAFDKILEADIMTFHVPLNLDGIDKTYHLLNKEKLTNIKPGTIIINTSRGSVIDNKALLEETNHKNFKLILDVWENEPSINTKLLEKVKMGTPHIAGYSFEGKVNGTRMIYDSLCQYLNMNQIWQPRTPKIEGTELRIPEGESDEERVYKLFAKVYNIQNDYTKLREIFKYSLDEQGSYFDKLRKDYPIRREFSNYTVQLSHTEMHLKSFLECFRFKVKIS